MDYVIYMLGPGMDPTSTLDMSHKYLENKNTHLIFIFEISNLYAFGLGFISSIPQFSWD
jgi:hypothetical protein